jgi:hypothetical protein
MIEKEHIIELLKDVEGAVKSQDIFLLRELSNKTVHSASIYQDPDSIAIAVTIYAVSKIFEKNQFMHFQNWQLFLKKAHKQFHVARVFLEKDNILLFRKEIVKIRRDVNLFGSLKEYIKDVFRKAYINKASRIYEHGISRAETSELLGITQWELAEYAVTPSITNLDLNVTKSIRERFKFTEELFEK